MSSRALAAEAKAMQKAPLTAMPIVERFFKQAAAANLDCLIWKSIDNLQLQLLGRADVDLLVHPRSHTGVVALLKSLGALPVPQNSIPPNLRMYVAYDAATGGFALFHLHRQMIFGGKNSKEYLYPQLNEVFAMKRLEDGYPIISHEHEFVMLHLEGLMKGKIGERRSRLLELKAVLRLQAAPLQRDLPYYLGTDVSGLLAHLESAEFATRLAPLAATVRQRLLQGQSLRFIWSRLFGRLLPYVRRFPFYLARGYRTTPRIHTVLLGMDGAGKSTTIANLQQALEGRLPSRFIYMGFNQFYWPSRVMMRLHAFCKERRIPVLHLVVWGVWSLMRRLDMRLRRRTGSVYAAVGYDVYYDRYFYDAKIALPSLDKPEPGWKKPLKRVLRWLDTRYPRPHLVVLLDVRPETAFKRKGQHSIEDCQAMYDQYHRIIDSIKASGIATLVVSSESNAPDAVVRQIIAAVWERKVAA